MRIIALATALAIAAFARGSASAQTAAPLAAAGVDEPQTAVRLFEPGTLSEVFAEETADTDWARPTEDRILAEIAKQPWPGLTRIEVGCRRSICAVLFVYSDGRDTESKIKDRLRKALGFVGIRAASKALPGATVSEVLFFR